MTIDPDRLREWLLRRIDREVEIMRETVGDPDERPRHAHADGMAHAYADVGTHLDLLDCEMVQEHLWIDSGTRDEHGDNEDKA